MEQQANSRFSYDGIALTCGQSRNRLDVRLRGEGATAEMYGAVIADSEQRADNNIVVEHLAPKCTSDMLYKYVLGGHSTGALPARCMWHRGLSKRPRSRLMPTCVLRPQHVPTASPCLRFMPTT